jgi:hypothetical protein
VVALTNLIPNGGFEYGTDSWSGINASNISPDTTIGSNALKITANGEAQSQPIAVMDGQSYT